MPERRIAPPASTEPSCLYPDEKEVARLIVGPDRLRTWPSLAVVLERSGLPKVDPMMGGRYWPGVRAFLDRYHKVGHDPAERASRRSRDMDDVRRS